MYTSFAPKYSSFVPIVVVVVSLSVCCCWKNTREELFGRGSAMSRRFTFVVVVVLKELVSVDTDFAASEWIPPLFHLVSVLKHTNLANSVAARGFPICCQLFSIYLLLTWKALQESLLE